MIDFSPKKVTPLSKGLAMMLFIALPFAGFWLGQKTINRVDVGSEIYSKAELVSKSCSYYECLIATEYGIYGFALVEGYITDEEIDLNPYGEALISIKSLNVTATTAEAHPVISSYLYEGRVAIDGIDEVQFDDSLYTFGSENKPQHFIIAIKPPEEKGGAIPHLNILEIRPDLEIDTPVEISST